MVHAHDSRNMMPTDLDRPSDAPGLSPQRIGSSIPRSEAEEGPGGGTWLYPSPQMFYNAMARKGYTPRAEDMDVIVTIHNMVNEQTWQEVLKWENYYHPGTEPKLRRFLGRPDSLSPRACFRSYVLGYRRPFDRHDWYVEREGREVRYVVDFYSGNSAGPSPSFHIDARPAIDSWSALYERAHCAANRCFDRLSSWANRQRVKEQTK